MNEYLVHHQLENKDVCWGSKYPLGQLKLKYQL